MKTKRFSKKLSLKKTTVANLGTRAMNDLRGGVIIAFCLTNGADSCNLETQVPECMTDPPTLCKTCPCTDPTEYIEVCPYQIDHNDSTDCQVQFIGIAAPGILA